MREKLSYRNALFFVACIRKEILNLMHASKTNCFSFNGALILKQLDFDGTPKLKQLVFDACIKLKTSLSDAGIQKQGITVICSV